MSKAGLLATRLAAMVGSWTEGNEVQLADTPVLAALMAHWQSLRGGLPEGATPPLHLLSLAALGPAGAYTAIVDLSDGVDQAWYRSAGPALTRLWGRDLQGRRLADCYQGVVWQDVRRAYAGVAGDGVPHFATREFRLFNNVRGYRRLLLPLADMSGHIGFVMAGICPGDPALVDAHQWRPAAEEASLLNLPGNAPFFD